MKLRWVRSLLPLLLLLALVALSLVYLYSVSRPEQGQLRASGTIEANDWMIAAEVFGRVQEVYVNVGEKVERGAPLLRLEDDVLQAQLERAHASLFAAQTALEMAQVDLVAAELELELTRRAARLQERVLRIQSWELTTPDEYVLPGWYFMKTEEIEAAEREVRAAEAALQMERETWEQFIKQLGAQAFLEAETRLADARAAFVIAEEVRDRARRAREDEALQDFAETRYDAAEEELEAAQSAYDEMLMDNSASDVLEARARLAVAQERLDAALDRLTGLQSGAESLQVVASQVRLEQAHLRIEQAQATVTQAQAELDLLGFQAEKLILTAPVEAVVTSRDIQVGEVVQPGGVLLTLDRMDRLSITVYVSEDRYGAITLGHDAVVRVDSFPEVNFTAQVVRIADEAEFTPRNVQTEEGRRTTVFAVELELQDPSGRLKPGMPADVEFETDE